MSLVARKRKFKIKKKIFYFIDEYNFIIPSAPPINFLN